LKLTGQFILRPPGTGSDEFIRLILELEDGQQIRFCDRNGAAEAFIVSDVGQLEKFVGPEPFEVLLEEFEKNVRQSERKTIKETILDQKVIAGVGNIYADEALFLAGISPFRTPVSLSTEELSKLLEAVKQVLREGIEHRGTTIDSYRDLDGNPGTHQNFLRIYGKGGKPCQNCSTAIILTELGGRRTHYCPIDQPESQLSLF
jgi:formamidopyrimidine-DNA glycosylase